MSFLSSTVGAFLGGFPLFLAYLLVSFGFLVAFAFVYMLITPEHEIELIKAGHTPSAVTFGGSLLGFSIPFASAISHSHNILEMLLWSTVALAVQVGAHFLAAWLVAYKTREGVAGRSDYAAPVFMAFAALSAGIVNAACMAP
jgi:putative membrane protein